jgi:hypothetical protein
MRDRIIFMVLPALVEAFLAKFDDQAMKLKLDEWIDLLEDRIAESPSEIDDALLPVVHTIRMVFNIPDND